MDERADRGEFYPGGDRSGGAPAPQPSDKVDRVNVGEVGESYTLKDVKKKVNQIVRAIAPAVTCLALAVVRLLSYAATAPHEDIPNTAPVVTNEEDAVAMAAVGALGAAVSNRVEAAEGSLKAEIAGATNAVVQAALRAAEAESNRVDSTFAKRSEIPAAPDLAPYALKSELPTDYITENDITNFATRAWMSAQGYATEAEMRAKIEAQDLRIGEATNAVWRAMGEGTNRLWAANAAASNRVNAATNAIWIAMRAESNRLETAKTTMDAAWRAGTNATMRALRAASNELARADARLDAEIEALELTGGMTRLWASDATTYQDATGVVWQVQVVTGQWTVVHSWTTTGLNWEGPWWWGAEGAGEDYYEGPGWYISSSTLTPMRMSEDQYEREMVVGWSYWEEQDEQEHSITTTCSRTVQWFTNAVNRVAYTNDMARMVPGDYETVSNRAMTANNYTDTVAAEFADGTREVATAYSATVADNAANASFADEAEKAQYLLGGFDKTVRWEVEGLLLASTNAALEVVGSATNGLPEAIGRKQDALPYPTNAIPYTVISGGPSGGGQEWSEVTVWTEAEEPVHYVTNGMMHVIHGTTAAFTVQSAGWPNGAAMYVDWDYGATPIAQLPSNLRLVGYGTWPTNNFQSVWWRSGATIYVNILIEE